MILFRLFFAAFIFPLLTLVLGVDKARMLYKKWTN